MKIIFSLLFLSIHAAVFSQSLQLVEPIRFLALGDSYTIGQSVDPQLSWPNQLYNRLAAAGYKTEKLEIIATTGWRTDNLANAIATENPPSDFNLVSLLIGVNDQYQGKPFSGYEPAFTDLLNTAIALAGGIKEHVFVVSIPDYAYTPYGGGNTKISQDIDQYNAMNKSIAENYGITYFDITPISRQGLDEPDLVASDNLHPSGLQYTRWVDLMTKQLNITLNNEPNSSNKKKVLIYPNPTNQLLRITIDEPDVNSIYKIYNPLGNLALSGQANDLNTSVDISSLTKGFYYFILNDFETSFLVEK